MTYPLTMAMAWLIVKTERTLRMSVCEAGQLVLIGSDVSQNPKGMQSKLEIAPGKHRPGSTHDLVLLVENPTAAPCGRPMEESIRMGYPSSDTRTESRPVVSN